MPKDYKVAEWELKPWWYKIKYSAVHHPQILASAFVFGILGPLSLVYWEWRYNLPDGKVKLYRRFKRDYFVLRDDDPEVALVERVENPDPMYTFKWF